MAYKRKGGSGPRAGFSLVEVIVSVALIALISTGFLYMMAANSQLLSREYRLDRSSYELGALADRGEGKAGEKVLTVYFQMDSGETLEEYFREYTVGEDGENRITYFRHE